MPRTSSAMDRSTKKPQTASVMMGIAALGVVFGDIGTSPLYTLKTVLALSGGDASPRVILGLLSMLFWTLIIVTSIKYVSLAMRIDNNGEGGILALMSLLGLRKNKRPLVVAVGLFGAALLYGDGAITPAISVLSALEGINLIWPHAKHYVLPVAVLILCLLFIIQPLGTQRIGKTFGPIMTLWFASIALLGVWGIIHHPAVLLAINPLYALKFMLSHGYISFLVMGGVFLCVTGAEALYADMGHFGPQPIRMAWYGMVFPSLLLNYAGQAALVLSGTPVTENIFFLLCPPVLLIPLVILATLATIIASQAIITGTFSITRQAIQLGWLPPLRVKQTSAEGYGQIYVGVVNWLLMIATISLVVGFRSSDNLASAYGIAVSMTMLMTSGLLFMAMREIWHWNLLASLAAAGTLMLIDIGFVFANMMKILDGGYVPLVLASLIYGVMCVWHRGITKVTDIVHEKTIPIREFIQELEDEQIPRVPGCAVFLTRTAVDAPPVMRWHVKRNRALHEKVFILHVTIENIPWVTESQRIDIRQVIVDLYRVHARYGFMERPNIPLLLSRAIAEKSLKIELEEITYYLGHENIVVADEKRGLARCQSQLFALMMRNGAHITDRFQLPNNQVVEISRRIPF